MGQKTPVQRTDAPPAVIPRGDNRFALLSHDLRAALADVHGGLKLIDAERLDAETRAHFDRVLVSSETLARLLDKSLGYDGGHWENELSRPTNMKLKEFLEDIRKRWQGRAEQSGIEFILNCQTSLPAILTLDRLSLDRIISNLIGNALKFTDDGQVTLAVSCDENNSLVFKVFDDGPGVPEEAISRLFQYETRAQGTGKPGSGLGLFISKELSDILGATLEITNRKGVTGTEARLVVPHDAWFDRSLRRAAKPDGAPVDPEPVNLSGIRILLAEDNKTNQLVATQMLKSLGAEFAVASDGLEALKMLETQTFDLALLDIEMPRMSGLELIREVRTKQPPLADMPLVALTAYVMREHRERIYAAGADGIVAKPLMSISDLGQAILDYLTFSKSRAAEPTQNVKPETTQPLEDAVDRAVFDNLIETIGPESTGELLKKLQSDTDAVAEGLVRGRKSLDLAEIRAQTHILISVAGAIGAGRLLGIARRLNAAANSKEADQIDALCKICLSGLAELQGFILNEQAGQDLRR